MEKAERAIDRAPRFDVQAVLERTPGISHVQKIALNESFFQWLAEHCDPSLHEDIKKNYESLDAFSFQYFSDGLSIAGFLWAPKHINEQIPLVVWNRGGTGPYGSIGDKVGLYYSGIPCEIAKSGAVVVASQYRGGSGSEGSDERGGADLRDVDRIREIASELPFCRQGKSVVVGLSRGGMMSYLLAAKESWVKAVVSLSGTADETSTVKDDPEMADILRTSHGGSFEEAKKRSAVYFYEEIPKNLPLLLIHGTEDQRVPVRHTRRLYELLKESGHSVEYCEVEGADHFFYQDVSSSARAEVLEKILSFVKRYNMQG